MTQDYPDINAFRIVSEQCYGSDKLRPLTCKDIADVFGWPAIELMLLLSSTREHPELIQLLTEIRDEFKRVSGEKKLIPSPTAHIPKVNYCSSCGNSFIHTGYSDQRKIGLFCSPNCLDADKKTKYCPTCHTAFDKGITSKVTLIEYCSELCYYHAGGK